MTVEFEIEKTFSLTDRGAFVTARLLSASSAFTISEQPALGSVPIERWFDIPRSTRSDGSPRLDLFVFKFARPEDRDRLQPGQTVILE
jgi:hypothetical protein